MTLESTGSTKEFLTDILEWLKSGAQTDLEWTIKTEKLKTCLTEMQSASLLAPAEPYVEAMLIGMLSRNRRRAFDSGVDALATLQH